MATAANRSKGQLEDVARPPVHIENPTPSDTAGAELSNLSTAIMVGSAGNVGVIMADGSVGIMYGLLAGVMYPARIRQVRSTGTTASSIAVYA